MGTSGCPPQRRSTGSAGARTTTTSQVSVALRSLVPAFSCIPTAVLPHSRVFLVLLFPAPQPGAGGKFRILGRHLHPRRTGGSPFYRRTRCSRILAAHVSWEARTGDPTWIGGQPMDSGPGWLPDPKDGDRERYWNGSDWTDRVRPAGKT